MAGFIGRVLKVNLSTQRIQTEELAESFYRRWFGTYGLAARIIYSEMRQGSNPLGPDNIIGLTTGILTGTPTPFSGSFTVVGKSPLTGTWGDSRGGGYFGPELKRAGFDDVFVTGRSSRPSYVWIDDGKVSIMEAGDIWGKGTIETEEILREKHKDERIQVVSIGPSGEKLSRISSIITDAGRAAARSGLGAAMGSKNLKAVAVRGNSEVPLHDQDALLVLRKKFLEGLNRLPLTGLFRKYGTCMGTTPSAYSGDSPVKNWAGVGKEDFPTADRISGDNVVKYVVGPYACWGCPIACGARVEIEKGPYAVKTHRPEYETLAAYGTLCLNDNLESIIYLSAMCNDHGIDTISAGGTIAFAIECYENGILTKEDTGGIELTWGNVEAIVRMTEKMAMREGLGDILADGVKIASQRIGKGSERFAMHVGGQEVPMHDPRMVKSFYNRKLGVTYIVDATPGRHNWNGSNEQHAYHALGVCNFLGSFGAGGGGFTALRGFANAVTGWGLVDEDLKKVGESIANLRQAFNVREGFRPSDFKLPDRILGKPPMKSGPLAGVTLDLESPVAEYFRTMEWDYATGKPSQKKLIELGLEDVAEDLYEKP